MLTKILQRFSSKPAPAQPNQASQGRVASPPSHVGAPVYPPIDGGVALGGPQVVLATQADMIRRLRLMAGTTNEEFDRLYGSVLTSLASYLDLLPASASGTHMGAGGLFRLALEIAFYARQASEGVVFAGRDGVEKRRILEPRWQYATFLAGMCCELYRPLSRMVIVTENGKEWPMHRLGLADWLKQVGETRYFIRWIEEDQQYINGSAAALAARIIPDTSMQYMQEGHSKIISAMLDAVVLDQAQNRTNPVAEVVWRMRQKVIDRDTVIAPQNYGKLTVGTHLEPHLLDAMRQLVRDKVWLINQKKSRLWFGADGLFIVWRTAAKEIRDVLARNSVTGIPQDETTLAEALLKSGAFVSDGSGEVYWRIKTPLSESELVAVRLASPEILLVALEEEDLPKRLDCNLSLHDDEGSKTPELAEIVEPRSAPEVVQAPVVDESQPDEAGAGQAPETSSRKESKPAKTKKTGANQHDLDLIDGEGAIQPPPEVEVQKVPGDIGDQMTSLVRAVMEQLLKDSKAPDASTWIVKVPEGMAISMEQLAGYGVEVNKIMIELSNLGWLHVAPDNPKRKLHQVQIKDRAIQCAILRTQVAMDMGFKL